MALRPQPSLEHDPDRCGIGTTGSGGVPAICSMRGSRSGAAGVIGIGKAQSSSPLNISTALVGIGALLCCIGARGCDAATASTAAALSTPLHGGAAQVSSRGWRDGRRTTAPHPPSWRGIGGEVTVRGIVPRPVPRTGRAPRAPTRGVTSSTTTSLEYRSDVGLAPSGGGGFVDGGGGARRSPSAEAVASYLEALSSGSIAAPSEDAVSSYLGALSAGKVGAPPTADAIASYLGSVAVTATEGGRRLKTSEGEPGVPHGSAASASGAASPASDARVSPSRSHLDLIAGACRGDEDAEGEECRRAVVSYAHAVTIRGAPPSTPTDAYADKDEEQVPKAAAGGEMTAVPSEPRRPSHPVAAIVEGYCRRVKSEGGRTLYDVLELSPDATAKDIKRQYVALARLSHPDAVASATRRGDVAETDNFHGDADFSEIAAAYRVLSNARLRMRYDRSLWAESFTRDVGRAADEIGRVAGPPVVDLFRRLMRGTISTASAAMSAAVDALRGDHAAHGGLDGGGAAGVTRLDSR